jgi:two-component system, OmpR family, sensor histidine kinase KdpD
MENIKIDQAGVKKPSRRSTALHREPSLGTVEGPRDPIDAAYALPASFTALLILGAVTAACHGRVGAVAVLVAACFITAILSFLTQPAAVAPMVVMAWLTVTAFSKAPYGQLQSTVGHAAVVAAWLSAAALAGLACGIRARYLERRHAASEARFLDELDERDDGLEASLVLEQPVPGVTLHELAVAVSRRRQIAALAFGCVVLPLLTVALVAMRSDADLDDELLLYLSVVLVLTLIGGFWPAVAGAVAASLLINWYFTPPLHDWTISSPQNLFALLLFVTVAVAVSSVVHLAARRNLLARRSSTESETLLELARSVLGGDDTAPAVVANLAEREAVGVELQELVAGRWIRLAAAGEVSGHDSCLVSQVRDDLRLRLFGERRSRISPRTLEGYGAQAATALDRERLRVQAAQSEVLAAGNRMRTALLAAVSHDLRTPLAVVKASVSSLRQTDVELSADDQAELLAEIEDNADRLDSLIANLLDMSRIQTGSLEPLLRPTSLEEIVPLALLGLDAAEVELDIPDTLPTVATDPGLLERAIANLVANALRYSPPGQPPRLAGRVDDDGILVEVVDHGPGVPVEQRERIFEPFQQLGDQHTGEGVGLGLAVARGFVEATGGTITATETPGGGLTMRLSLRVAAAVGSVSR